MTDTPTPPPEEVDEFPYKSLYGRGIAYELKGEKCEVAAFALSDGGVQFEFKRGDQVLPVRLSPRARQAVFVLLQELFWDAPPQAKKEGE